VSPTVFAVPAFSMTWALITFNVTTVAYTPEQYRVVYNIISNDTYLYSDILTGSQNITSANSYAIILSNLLSNTQYNYSIVSTNNGSDNAVFSTSSTFTTYNEGT